MSSNRLVRKPGAWSLRLRLLVGQILVLAVVCVGITAGTELALHHHLVAQLDGQLGGTSHRSALMYPESSHRFWRHQHRYWRPGPGPRFLDAPGQPAGMVGAVVRDGKAIVAGYLTNSGDRAEISPTAQAQLAAVAGGQDPVTLNLDGLGRYRVVSALSRRGDELIVTGLSMSDVDATMIRMLIIFGIVTVVALVAATTAGAIIIRRALAPLRRVAQTATEVVDLPLDRGEVELPVRVSETDANPDTEVGQLGSGLNRMLDHIAAALSTRQASETRVRQFVADASHELRTPLAAIRGYTELAQRMGDDRAAVAHAMSRVGSETERITSLVEDLLLLARLDSGRPLEREPVDMSRLAVDAVSDAHIAGPDQQWELDLPAEPVVVTGDAARLHQVVANLLANARIHTGPGAVVTTRLSSGPTHVVLEVIDNGPGIPEAMQSEIFERFARGDTSRSRKGGSTGLGLAIVAAVVKAHNGTMTVNSSPGRTEFAVRLPLDAWQRSGVPPG
ncbi:HAMP domain-containing sensor histidine kinase [Mycobacterium ulcerans]|uniref:histidine kinase n=1 Tax=Mycobacterium ulcerans TaxID=1809 RepID=A0ABY3V823_MYCUL|nr:HAMP domain-containing sensor histidine kinase [Mycobacterium ulcerans]MEB3967230.1 HAMP domain-containing sensor histidine kinase [Mycobacterium ulcerans]MEB3975592.1 HAMP domain-containing sensor histidine kinase [Mycobacterium ulcerans]MEB4004863.1 HAMP domain-containing sensor histidine kinase [Mycobacterium ulcerans]MEB4414432.1 HAMP domain-containing sensor histidine kinase [Mycobacterium ulcerans]MEB4432485.1 HAMP domain-containing sensor histidine kinase [Mycobacterium ulcerans]